MITKEQIDRINQLNTELSRAQNVIMHLSNGAKVTGVMMAMSGSANSVDPRLGMPVPYDDLPSDIDDKVLAWYQKRYADFVDELKALGFDPELGMPRQSDPQIKV